MTFFLSVFIKLNFWTRNALLTHCVLGKRGSKEPRKSDIPWQEIGFSLNKKKIQNFHTFNLELLFVTLKNKNYSTAVLFLCKLFLISSMTLFALLLSLGLPSRKKWLKNFLSAAALRVFFSPKEKFYSQWMKTLKKALLTELEIDDTFFFCGDLNYINFPFVCSS